MDCISVSFLDTSCLLIYITILWCLTGLKWAANNLFAIARQTDGPTNLTNEPGIPNGPGRHAKFQNPRAIPSRRNYGSKKEREKTQLIMATPMISTCTSLRPI